MNRKFIRIEFFSIFCDNLKVFTVTFKQFYASLMKKRRYSFLAYEKKDMMLAKIYDINDW